jgi:hypothetical protein
MSNLSALENLKQKLQHNSNTSELWYLRQKVQQFESSLRNVESFYQSTYEKLLLLEEQLSIHCNPVD